MSKPALVLHNYITKYLQLVVYSGKDLIKMTKDIVVLSPPLIVKPERVTSLEFTYMKVVLGSAKLKSESSASDMPFAFCKV